MKGTFLKNLGKTALEKAQEKSPVICIGVCVAAGVAAVGAAIVATRKAEKVLEEHRNDIAEIEARLPEEPTEQQVADCKKAKAERIVKTGFQMAKTYAVTIILLILMATGAICSHRINVRRQMALEAAFAVTKQALDDKDSAMEKLLGQKKAKMVTDEAAKEKVKRHPLKSESQIVVTGAGDVICFDEYSGRYFRSNPEYIRKVVNDLNMRLRDEMQISLNDFYYEIGLRAVPIGDQLGWNVNEGSIDVTFSSMLTQDIEGFDLTTMGLSENTPILVISYEAKPKYNYYGDF